MKYPTITLLLLSALILAISGRSTGDMEAQASFFKPKEVTASIQITPTAVKGTNEVDPLKAFLIGLLQKKMDKIKDFLCALLFHDRCKPGVESNVATNFIQLVLNFFGLGSVINTNRPTQPQPALKDVVFMDIRDLQSQQKESSKDQKFSPGAFQQNRRPQRSDQDFDDDTNRAQDNSNPSGVEQVRGRDEDVLSRFSYLN